MDFIEREKLRIEEEQKKKDAEKKAKEDLDKRKELELQNKRDSIYKKVGPFMEKLLQKTIEKQQQAEAEKLPDPIDKLSYHEKFRGWKWKIDWDNPRLCGHFKTGEGFCKNVAFDSKGKASYFFPGTVTTTTYYFTIYIKCLVDIGKMALNITAKAEEHIDSYFVEEDEHNHSYKSLQALYLENKGLIIPITKDASLIDRIADILVEMRYTWKCQLAEKNLGKLINNSIIKLESSLKLYDNIINEKNGKLEIIKKKKEKDKTSFSWKIIIGITSGIIFLIWIMHDKAGFFSIIGNLIVGGFLSVIVFFIIAGITHIIFNFFKYGYSEKDEKKDSQIIKNYETNVNHKNSEITDLLKNIRATIDNDNIEEFVGDEIVLEFPLTDEFAESEHYTKKDFISKIDRMIKRSKYEES